jgi:nitrogen-specific signal transduction histidine kinase/CheY-like chemotaxis protein
LPAESDRELLERTRQVESSRSHLRQAQKLEALGQLTGGVAHDFNNLLAVMTANLELSLRKLDREHEVVPEIERSLVAAERAATLTHRLLAFSRRQALRPWPTDVNELVTDLIDLLDRTLGETIDIKSELESRVPPILVDPVELETALINLAINARDAMPGGGTLTLRTGAAKLTESSLPGVEVSPGEYVMLQIADTGLGIPVDDVKHVFEPFFTTKAVGKGSGLGLSMVRGFAEQSGGHVDLASRQGAGTEVTLYLPRYEGSDPIATSRPAPRTSSVRPPPGAPVVLVVEDNAEFSSAAVSMCESLGYGAVSARDAEEALEKLPGLPHVRLVLTDVGLPKMSGPDFLERLQSFRPDLTVALMSGYAVDDVSSKVDPATNLRMLTKPFRRGDLARLLAGLLVDDSTSD